MPLFDRNPGRLLKKLRKYAEDGNLTRIQEIIEDEKELFLEDGSNSLRMTEFLLEIGFPDIAAEFAEKAMKIHRSSADDINEILVRYYSDFNLSSKLLKTIWLHYLYRHNFDAALSIMQEGRGSATDGVIAESKEGVSRVWNKAGRIHPQANQIPILAYAFCCYISEETSEALEILWKVFRDIEFPHRSISALADWINARESGLGTDDRIALLGISIVSGKFENAREYLREFQTGKLSEVLSEEQLLRIISIVEERMFALDDTVYSTSALFTFYMKLEKLSDALRILKSRRNKFLDRDEYTDAVRIIAQHSDADAKALLFTADYYITAGDYNRGRESLDLAFSKADESDTGELMQMVRRVIDDGMDSDFRFSRKLSVHLVSSGTPENAINALSKLLKPDPSWVFLQVESLINRDRRNASVLSFLSAVLMENGRFEKAAATLKHLLARDDRLSVKKSLAVFELLEEQVAAFPALREARALLRLKSGMTRKAASDWLILMLGGEEICTQGQEILRHIDVNPGTCEALDEVGFVPSEPFSSLVAGMIYIREGETSSAAECFRIASERHDYHLYIARTLMNLPDDVFGKMGLQDVLPLLTGEDSSRMTGGILLRVGGTENWKIELLNDLHWKNSSEGAYFRLRYLLENGKLYLAGSSFDENENDDPVLSAIAESCRQITAGQNRKALALLKNTVDDPEYSRLSAFVLRSMISLAPSIETEIRLYLAKTAITLLDLDEVGKVLEPVCSEEGVVEFAEKVLKAHNGSVPLLNVLVKASVEQEDFLRFRRYSSVLIDVDPGMTGMLSETALHMAEISGLGEAWLHAARLARIENRNADIDDYVISALYTNPEIGHSGTIADLGVLGSSVTVLHAASICDAELFSRTAAECPSETIPLNGKIVNGCLETWKPKEDGEALSALAEIALSAELTGYAEEIFAVLSIKGEPPWNEMASERLLQEAAAGRMESLTFWRSVSDSRLIEKGLSKLLPDGFTGISDIERKEVAESVLSIGVSLERLIELSRDNTLFEDAGPETLRKLAELCLAEVEGREISPEDANDVVKILADGNMMPEAVQVCRSFGSDNTYKIIREYVYINSIITSTETDGIEEADAWLRLNDPVKALALLEGLDEDLDGYDDQKARALWMLNFRAQSVSTRIGSYHRTGDRQMLLRLVWALQSMGCSMETAALRRYLAEEHPEIANLIRLHENTGKDKSPEVISGLHLQSFTKEREHSESEKVKDD